MQLIWCHIYLDTMIYGDDWNDWKWQVTQHEDGRFSGKSGERVGVEERKIEHLRKRVGKASLYIHKW